jgi:serine phosphatase RsbU (regulator of sigma subunit)
MQHTIPSPPQDLPTRTASLAAYRRPLSYRRRLADERRISHALQHAIQPAIAVSHLDGVQIAVRCRSADPALRIGGDWYLVQPLANGDLLMAIGDVAGHGLDAVETMIGMRYAMAAYAAEGHPPATILTRLNMLLNRANQETAATAAVVTYRPSTGRIVWAGAGHPPVLLAGPRRVVRLDPQGPLLGVLPAARFTQETRQLPPGHSVLLYTDGLIKRGTFDHGIELLADQITGLGGHPAGVLDRLDFGATRDDACALLAKRTG